MSCIVQKPNPSDVTSKLEGSDLSLAKDLWVKTAAAECRLNLIRKLMKEKLGFKEVEDYDKALELKLKSEKLKKSRNNSDTERKIVREIMGLKLKDADICHREALSEQNKTRRKINELVGKNTRRSRTIFKRLRQDSGRMKKALENKYEEKLQHLRRKYSKKTEEKLRQVPEDLIRYKDAGIFGDKYNEEREFQPAITILRGLEVDDEERAAASLHPKFAILPRLSIEDFWQEMELGFAKLRYELSREKGEKLDDEEEIELTEEEKEKYEEIEAKSRQFFDPEEQTFDYRKKRVTDLKENTRVTLPKPVEPSDEARIELRRGIYEEVFNKYIEKHCKR